MIGELAGMLLLSAAFGQSAKANADCSHVRLPEREVCRANPNGLVLSDSSENADWGVKVASGVEAKFSRYFGSVPRYALFVQDDDTDLSAELTKAGYRRQFLWPSPETAAARVSVPARAALREAFLREGMSEPELTAQVEQSLALMSRSEGERGASNVAQELGHQLLESFWERKPRSAPAPHYGTPGPDWLDEIAAILMESKDSHQARRHLFAEMYRRGQVVPLRTYLKSTHPGLLPDAAPIMPDARSIPARTAPAEEEAARHERAGEYYAQSLGFAEFLLEKSGRPRIFEAIARRLSSGLTFDQWLRSEGKRYGLTCTGAGLDRMWQAWMLRRARAQAARTTAAPVQRPLPQVDLPIA